MYAYAEVDKTCQPTSVDEDVYILNPIDMLPDDYDDQRAEDEDREEDHFWNHPRNFTSEENHLVWTYLHAVECGWCKPETAVNDLISFDLFPHTVMLEMLATYLRSLQYGETA